MFIKYPKIHRLGKDENEGILDRDVFIQEKLDGANLSIWKEDDGVHVGSRNQDITNKTEGNFRGAVEYVKNHKGINDFLDEFPSMRLYGEWLIKHSIEYDANDWNHFYLFDIYSEGIGFMPVETVYAIAELQGIKTPHLYAGPGKFTEDEITVLSKKCDRAPKGEGVVIKPVKAFINQFGDNVYAKVVTQEFLEKNTITFGGNNKHSDSYWEQYIVNKYVTPARVKKTMQKTQSMLGDEKLDMKHTPRIANSTYHDVITEEMWEIQKKVPEVNLKKLKTIANKKAIMLYHQLLKGETMSVAYKE